MNPPSLGQGWHTQFLTKFQKLDGFGLLSPVRVRSRLSAYARVSGNGPPGIGPKLACARPLSRRKTSPNGHKTLSADGSRHALQLSSYKRPLKRPLNPPNRPGKNTHFLPFSAPPAPQTYGVNGHTRCRRSNQTKQTSGAAFPDPCSHTKVPLVFL